MRRHGLALLLCLALLPAHAFDQAIKPLSAQGTWQALFSPWDSVEDAIIKTIRGAEKQVLVQAYLLTSLRISKALVDAHRRGIDVRVLVDARQAEQVPHSRAHNLVRVGIPVWRETRYRNAHNKVMVIDAMTRKSVVITGSYNFTWSAQHKNAENVLVVRSNTALAKRYAANWARHRKDAERWH